MIYLRCDLEEIQNCSATANYSGYIWEDSKKTQSCQFYEATADDNGNCVQIYNSTKQSCKNGPYIFSGFEFDSTTITEFNVLCEDGFIEGFFRSVSI